MHDRAIYNHNKKLVRSNKKLTREWIAKDGRIVEICWKDGIVIKVSSCGKRTL